MPIRATCPNCGSHGDIAGFLIEDDARLLIARVAAMDSAFGKAVLRYLTLFAPPSRRLQLAKALRLVNDLVALVDAGNVCRDERGGLRRPTTPQIWTAGMEHMATTPPSGLPLSNHNYLRSVVFDLANQSDAKAEATREASRQGPRRGGSPAQPREDRIANERAFLAQSLHIGTIDRDEYDRRLATIEERLG